MAATVIIAAAVLWAAGWLMLRRMRELPPVEAETPAMNVSVIVPARNEEHNLPGLLGSLAGQGALEVIVADDGSRDRTAAIAEEFGARVVRVSAPPTDEWRGKTWACWTAARQATGDILVFLDADTELQPGALMRLASQVDRRGGIVSAEPYHWVPSATEQLSLAFNVIRVAGVGPDGAFGPCVAMRRDDYLSTGGHANHAVRGQVLEHFALGRVARSVGLPVRGYVGRGAVRFRMYPEGLSQLVQGWAKGLASGAATAGPVRLLLSILWVSGGFLATGALAVAMATTGPVTLIAAAATYAAYAAQTWWMARRVGSFALVGSLVYPLLLLMFVMVFARSSYLVHWRGQVVWKGRRIALARSNGG